MSGLGQPLPRRTVNPDILNFEESVASANNLDEDSRHVLDEYVDVFHTLPIASFMVHCTNYGRTLGLEQRVKGIERMLNKVLTSVDDLTRAVSSEGSLTADQEAELRKISKNLVGSAFREMKPLKDDIIKEARKNAKVKVLFETGPGERKVKGYIGDQASYVKGIVREILFDTTIRSGKGGFSQTAEAYKDQLTGETLTAKQGLSVLFCRGYVRKYEKFFLKNYGKDKQEGLEESSEDSREDNDPGDAPLKKLSFPVNLDRAMKHAKKLYGNKFGSGDSWKSYLDALKREEVRLWPEDDFSAIIPAAPQPANTAPPQTLSASAHNLLNSQHNPLQLTPTPTSLPAANGSGQSHAPDHASPQSDVNTSPSPSRMSLPPPSHTPTGIPPHFNRTNYHFSNPLVDHDGRPAPASGNGGPQRLHSSAGPQSQRMNLSALVTGGMNAAGLEFEGYTQQQRQAMRPQTRAPSRGDPEPATPDAHRPSQLAQIQYAAAGGGLDTPGGDPSSMFGQRVSIGRHNGQFAAPQGSGSDYLSGLASGTSDSGWGEAGPQGHGNEEEYY